MAPAVAATTTRSESLSQSEYKETTYADQSWELVGDPIEERDFVPLAVDVVPRSGSVLDPMFADFGGTTPAEARKRWHSDEGSSLRDPKARSADESAGTTLREEEIQKLREEAYAQGRADALVEAAEQSTKKLEQLEARLGEVFHDLEAQHREQIERVEKAAVDLALQVSHKLLEAQVEENPEYIFAVVREALGHVGGASIECVRVSPQDFEFIQVVGVAKQLAEFDGKWTFQKDDSIQSGCVVQTSAGEVDYRLDEAFERLRKKIRTVLK